MHDPRDADGGMPSRKQTLLYLILPSLIGPFVFLLWKFGEYRFEQAMMKKVKGLLNEAMHKDQFVDLQKELFPEMSWVMRMTIL